MAPISASEKQAPNIGNEPEMGSSPELKLEAQEKP